MLDLIRMLMTQRILSDPDENVAAHFMICYFELPSLVGNHEHLAKGLYLSEVLVSNLVFKMEKFIMLFMCPHLSIC